MPPQLTFERTIQAAPPHVFRMFTNAIALREWLCDQAMADARPGGYFSVVWNNGYFASGQYNLVQASSEVGVTWRGKNDPDVSQVRVLIEPEGGNSKLTVIHSGLGEGSTWDAVVEEIRAGWETALENLVHVLEQGPDLRIVTRPMLGMVFGEFSPDVAERLNVPLRSGVRLGGVLEGLGADRAGLQKDDVLCEISGKGLNNPNDVAELLRGKHAGEKMEVTYYRGPEKRTVTMELARRPLPEIPMDALGLAERVEKIYQEDFARLQQAVVGVSDEEAGYHPTESEWSVKDVISHLIISERWYQTLIVGQILSRANPNDDYDENVLAQVRAVTTVFGTVDALLVELKQTQQETVALLRNLPADFVSRKSSMWLMGFGLLSFPFHATEHVEQIQGAVAKAREAAKQGS